MTTNTALTFKNTTFSVIDRNGEPWIKAGELAQALGYSREDKVNELYSRNADEFGTQMTETLKMGVSEENKGLQKTVRIFSLRGAHLVAMFARTAIAKEFRAWVLDIIDHHLGKQQTETLTPSEQQTLMEIVKAKVAHLSSEQQGKGVTEVWSRVHHQFRVAKYSQLPRTQLTEVILYVTNMELRSVPNPPRAPELCSQEQRSQLSRRTAYAGEHAHMAKSLAWAISDRVRREMGVSSMLDLPASSFQSALDLIETLGSKAFMLKSRVIDIEKRFCLLVIRDGSASALAEFEALFSEELQAMLTSFAAPDALPMPSKQKALPI